MNKQMAEGMLGYFRMVLGVSRKLIDQFPEDKLSFKPTDAQRSVAETVSHMYTFLTAAMCVILFFYIFSSVAPSLLGFFFM